MLNCLWGTNMSNIDEEVDEGTEQILKLQEICRNLGWDIALDDTSENISGMIIGTREFIENLFSGDAELEGYDLYSHPDTDGELH